MRKFGLYLVSILLLISCKDNSHMKYETLELPRFFIVGISVRTTNKDGQSQKDIGDLWGKFMGQNIKAQIHNKESVDTYCVYTDYESDFNGKYTTILGCKVKSLDSIPAGMIGIAVAPTTFRVYISKGKIPECVVNTWMGIWKEQPERKYTADFDVYGPKAQDIANAEVETYLSVK